SGRGALGSEGGSARELRRVRLRRRGRGDPPPARSPVGGPGGPSRRRDRASPERGPSGRAGRPGHLHPIGPGGGERMTADAMPGAMGAPKAAMPSREGDFTVESHGMEPIPENARYGSVSRVFTVWFTPNLVPAAFFIGTLVTADFLKLGFITSLLAIIVG